MWAKLDEEGHQQPILKAETKQIYEKAFQFSEVAKNDATVEILADLEAAQWNLNQNPNNQVLLERFRKEAQTASQKLTQ